MKELEESIKYFNLMFTDTLTIEDAHKLGFDFDKEQVDYNNTISLFDLIDKFNKLYVSFKKEYQTLDKLNLGKEVEVLDFQDFSLYDNHFRFLLMHINKPLITNHQNTYLYLREFNHEICPCVTNGVNVFHEDYYHEIVNLDQDKVRKYLDLFQKYHLLLDLYNRFSSGMIFGNGEVSMFSKIESENDNILDNLESFTIEMYSSPYNSDGISLCVSLGSKLAIDSSRSQIVLGAKVIKGNNDLYLQILKSIYLNGQYLNSYGDRVNNDEKIKLKSLTSLHD